MAAKGNLNVKSRVMQTNALGYGKGSLQPWHTDCRQKLQTMLGLSKDPDKNGNFRCLAVIRTALDLKINVSIKCPSPTHLEIMQ